MLKSKKIVVLGHFGVGKSSLIRRFVTNTFSDNYQVTIGVHITKKVVVINADNAVSFIIWDLEGTDDLNLVRNSYLLGTHGIVFVFDVTRPSTFKNVNEDLKMLTQKAPKVPFLVVGNKNDLVVPTALEAVLHQNNIAADFLTSAKTGAAVDEMFLKLAILLHNDA